MSTLSVVLFKKNEKKKKKREKIKKNVFLVGVHHVAALLVSDRVLYPIGITRHRRVHAWILWPSASESPADDAAQVETIVVGQTR